MALLLYSSQCLKLDRTGLMNNTSLKKSLVVLLLSLSLVRRGQGEEFKERLSHQSQLRKKRIFIVREKIGIYLFLCPFSITMQELLLRQLVSEDICGLTKLSLTPKIPSPSLDPIVKSSPCDLKICCQANNCESIQVFFT